MRSPPNERLEKRPRLSGATARRCANGSNAKAIDRERAECGAGAGPSIGNTGIAAEPAANQRESRFARATPDPTEALIIRAQEQGHLIFDDINAALPADQTSPQQIDGMMTMRSELGIDDVIQDQEDDDAAVSEERGAFCPLMRVPSKVVLPYYYPQQTLSLDGRELVFMPQSRPVEAFQQIAMNGGGLRQTTALPLAKHASRVREQRVPNGRFT